ncbi:MAG: nucleotidyltransferase domain-containing protein [Candidatus Aminicenantes bacterium]|nr:nucleotidyltransferase domain-containing protein [Candidatus Aminicenantes bacterium]
MRSIETIKDRRLKAILSDIKEEVLKLFGDRVVQLILYGSYARNEQDGESDIDVLILVDEDEENLKKYRPKVIDIMTDLSLKYDTLISLARKTYDHYTEYFDFLPYYQNIYNEGVEIYGRKAA